MLLKKVVVENIRSHAYLEFEPSHLGTTAITGQNGAGKSTILNAFAFSLFGTKGQDLKIKDYVKTGTNLKKDKSQVTSYFVIGNREYKVERRIKSLTLSECNVYSRDSEKADEDFVLECGPAVSHSEKYLKKLIGMDEKGFYSAIFVQQKQVDQIITAPPKEKGPIIEKLIGISAISESIKMAKEDSRDLQKSLAVIQVGSVEDIEQELAEAKEKKKTVEKELSEKGKHLKDVEALIDRSEEILVKEKGLYEEYRKQKDNLTILQNEISVNSDRLSEMVDTLSKSEKVEYSEELHREVLAEKSDIDTKLSDIQREKVLLENTLREQKKVLDTPIAENIEEQYSSKVREIEEIKVEIEKKKSLVAVTKEKGKNNKLFIAELKKGTAVCPYCGKPIVDIEAEIKTHTEEMVEQANLVNKGNVEIETLNNRVNALMNETLVLQEQAELVKKQNEIKPLYAQEKKTYLELKAKAEALLNTKSITDKKVEELNTSKALAETIKTSKANIKFLNEKIAGLKTKEVTLQNGLNELNAKTESEINKLTKEYEDTKTEYFKVGTKIATLEKDVEISDIKVKQIEKQLDDCLEAKKRYDEISRRLTIVNSSVKSLSEFREDRIKKSIPALSEIGSELLNSFTNGDFTKMTVSEDFDVTVTTKGGVERAVTSLSGGELSAAAISLRVAIALFLNEGAHKLLILDEILVSMSDDRQLQILETLAGLKASQIILIAHSNVANSFADKVFKL